MSPLHPLPREDILGPERKTVLDNVNIVLSYVMYNFTNLTVMFEQHCKQHTNIQNWLQREIGSTIRDYKERIGERMYEGNENV